RVAWPSPLTLAPACVASAVTCPPAPAGWATNSSETALSAVSDSLDLDTARRGGSPSPIPPGCNPLDAHPPEQRPGPIPSELWARDLGSRGVEPWVRDLGFRRLQPTVQGREHGWQLRF